MHHAIEQAQQSNEAKAVQADLQAAEGVLEGLEKQRSASRK
jgi:hypothetical protein